MKSYVIDSNVKAKKRSQLYQIALYLTHLITIGYLNALNNQSTDVGCSVFKASLLKGLMKSS